jgi:hypothetical protein
MESEQVRELKQLQEENARLKKLVEELSFGEAILQDATAESWSCRILWYFREIRRASERRKPILQLVPETQAVQTKRCRTRQVARRRSAAHQWHPRDLIC